HQPGLTVCAHLVRIETIGCAAILRYAKHRRHPVDTIWILWIDANLRVVERTRIAEATAAPTGWLIAVSQRPGCTAVGRAVDAAVRFLALRGVRLFTAG